MAGPTNQDELNDIYFESGVDGSGNIAATSFDTWNGQTPPGYSTTSDIGKWHNDASGNMTGGYTATAGTASGDITYAFGTGVTAPEQTAFTDTLDLWSDEANLTFTQVASSATADVVFNVTSSGGTSNTSPTHYTSVNGQTLDATGQPNIASFVTPNVNPSSQDTITFNNSDDFGRIGDFSTEGGYGVGALTHEIGHMIGLGHSGPYNDGNAGSDPDTSQFNEFDSRQWSVMSYINPSDTNASYYGQYTVKGTNWTTTNPDGSTSQAAPETPMIDDILAAQQLYGASTTKTLSGGQVFGFNCNISDGANSFFNFAVNTNPVITLYDSGTNNTLDCSGFSTNCTINLNPGTFSTASAGTLTNNIGIAYNTQIDTAIGGSGNDSFTVNADNDTINGGGGSNTVDFSGARSGYVIAQTGNGSGTVTNTATGAVDTVSNIQTLQFSDQAVSLVCYASGTRIRTVRGDVAVEELAAGDLVRTASGALRPVRWLGHRTVDIRQRPEGRPVRISAHAFGADLPMRDLLVSPGHAICVDVGGEVLIPASALVNGTTIMPVDVDKVTYWHVELETHDVLLAENLPAESYMDCGNRGFFVESAVVGLDAPVDTPPGTTAGYCRPWRADGLLVAAARAYLQRRASRLVRASPRKGPAAAA